MSSPIDGAIGTGANALSVVLPTLACLFTNLKYRDGRRSYDGYQVLRVNASTGPAYQVLKQLYDGLNYDFWNPPSRNRPTDINICPEQIQTTKLILKALRIPYKVLIPNVKSVIDDEKRSMRNRQSNGMDWENYHRLDIINGWLDKLAVSHDFVSVVNIGSSYEGRPLKVLRISTTNSSTRGTEPKPSIWIDGGIHAREWVSPAVVTFMINELVQATVKNRQNQLVDVFDWYFLPNVNPDGYEFSHESDRMWRKTRSVHNKFLANVFRCYGADPNRNFEYHWGGKGTSNNPCADTYRGPSAASEIEISTLQNFILQRKEQFKLFLTFHSYSQMLFLPWGYDAIRTDDHAELMSVATKASKALESAYGTKFEVGPSPELLYSAAGGSEDFAKGIAQIKYAYCFELRDTGHHGFLLPPREIIPSGVETFAAVESMALDMIRIYNLTGDIPGSIEPKTVPKVRPPSYID